MILSIGRLFLLVKGYFISNNRGWRCGWVRKDEETVQQYAFNIQWHYSLNITEESDTAKYISPKTLWNSRNIIVQHDIEAAIFNAGTEKPAQVFRVKPSDSRKTLTEVGKDLFNLDEQFRRCPEVADMYSYKLLERVLSESVLPRSIARIAHRFRIVRLRRERNFIFFVSQIKRCE